MPLNGLDNSLFYASDTEAASAVFVTYTDQNARLG